MAFPGVGKIAKGPRSLLCCTPRLDVVFIIRGKIGNPTFSSSIETVGPYVLERHNCSFSGHPAQHSQSFPLKHFGGLAALHIHDKIQYNCIIKLSSRPFQICFSGSIQPGSLHWNPKFGTAATILPVVLVRSNKKKQELGPERWRYR